MSKDSIFRKKSLERISSPEDLQEYIKVSGPGIWVLLISVVVFLLGALVWGVFGNLSTKEECIAVSDGATTILYIDEESVADIEPNMEVRIGDSLGTLTAISSEAIQADKQLSDYALHLGGYDDKTWVFESSTDISLPQGEYKAEIITEKVNPIYFIMN